MSAPESLKVAVRQVYPGHQSIPEDTLQKIRDVLNGTYNSSYGSLQLPPAELFKLIISKKSEIDSILNR